MTTTTTNQPDIQMKPFKIDRNSWHFKLTRQFYDNHRLAEDFCSYSRRLMLSLMWSTILAAIVCALLFLPIDFIHWVYINYVNVEHYVIGPPAAIFLVICAITAIVAIADLIGNAYKKRAARLRHERQEKEYAERMESYTKPYTPPKPPEPSIFAVWWDSFHNKFCMPVEYTND